MRSETIAIHGGYEVDPTTKAVAVPIYQTVAYEFDSAEHGAALFNLEVDGFRYSRISNPTNAVLERKLARTGMITTAGFRDILELGRRTRPQPYGMTGTFVPVIPRNLRLEVAERMADRIGVISKGEIILVENKTELMHKLGKKQLTLELHQPLDALPPELARHNLALQSDGHELVYTYDSQGERTGITGLLQDLTQAGVRFKDLNTTQSSLEDIFVDLVRQRK